MNLRSLRLVLGQRRNTAGNKSLNLRQGRGYTDMVEEALEDFLKKYQAKKQ
jgi:hypothetical protein